MLTLLHLLSSVALLVWGTHIVRTGIMRVYGANLRRVLSDSVEKAAGVRFRHRRDRAGAKQQRHGAAGDLFRRAGAGGAGACAGDHARRRRRHRADGARADLRSFLAVAAADPDRRLPVPQPQTDADRPDRARPDRPWADRAGAGADRGRRRSPRRPGSKCCSRR